MKELPSAFKDYCIACQKLMAIVNAKFPKGQWVRIIGRGIIGKVFQYGENPAWITLILEHGQPRVYSVMDIEVCDPPYWAGRIP